MYNSSWNKFLKDVFICSLGAYGGPEAHYGVFTDQLVVKKKYLTEEELVELIALCSILPGPTSTQTIVGIGYKQGGAILAFFTMIVWVLPVVLLMTGLSFVYQIFETKDISTDSLKYIGPMAVGFILIAAYKIGIKVVTDKLTLGLFFIGLFSTYFIRNAWIFPIVLLFGAVVSILSSKESNLFNHVKLSPPWVYLIVFMGIILLGQFYLIGHQNKILNLFESFYRYGYLVFGGGQVVVPLMYTELVEINSFMTNQEFLTGYGLVQGLPGPMFSFSAYAGGMAARGNGILYQVLGALVGGIGIFLPGLLLIYFVYPIWENLKGIKAIKVSLKGINAVAGGLITTSAIVLMQKNGFLVDNIIVCFITILLLYSKKIPAPFIVLGSIVLGFIL